MESAPRKYGMYYRCPARTLTPGAEAFAEHPPSVYLREEALEAAVNAWLGGLFTRENLDRTVATLLADQVVQEPVGPEAAKKRLADAERQLTRFQDAIKAGIHPAALVEAMNAAQTVRAAAQAELAGEQASGAFTDAEVYAMIDLLGDVGITLKKAKPESLADLYAKVDLQVRYTHTSREADVTINLAARVNSVRVRGGT